MEHSTNSNEVAARRRHPSPEPQRQLGCWSWVGCLGKQKRDMRVVPASRPQDGSGGPTRTWGTNGTTASATADQFPGLSPSLLAPPSSPASFANSGNPSSVQSPANFTVSLSVASASVCSPVGLHLGRTATMFTIGPYAHETALVTPPAFSAFTTPPSTAPFTPPPELAHLTTPSSPDVPFAQFLASSFNAKGGMVDQCVAQNAASSFTSSDDAAVSEFNQLYPESPITQLVSPNSGASESEPSSPLPGPVSSSQEDNTQIAIKVEQETSLLILQPVDCSPLNLAFSANNFFPQRLRDTSCMDGSTASPGAEYSSDIYFHLPERHSDRCNPEWQADCTRDKHDDCQDRAVHVSHLATLAKNSKNSLEYNEANTSKEAQCPRDVEVQECQELQIKFSDDLFTSYNIDDNVKSGDSRISSFYVQNLLYPAAGSKDILYGNFEQGEGQWIDMTSENFEAVAECNLKPSDTHNGLGVFELGSKDLKHTLSDKSISFLPSEEKSSSPHLGAVVEPVSGALETAMSDSWLEIPRISFSIAEFLPPQEDKIVDKECDGAFGSSSSGSIAEYLKNGKSSSDCDVFAVALEQTKEVSTSNINTGGFLSRYHE